MYTDKYNFKGDHGSVAEELFSEVSTLEEKCLAVEESVAEGYFTLDEALTNYKVEHIEFLAFTLKSLSPHLVHQSMQLQAFKAISTVIKIFDIPIQNSFSPTGRDAISKIRILAQRPVGKSSAIARASKAAQTARAVAKGTASVTVKGTKKEKDPVRTRKRARK